MKITLYSSGCSRCSVLESKLKQKGIEFEINSDQKEMVKIGRENKIMSAPILVVDDNIMDFSKAVAWVNESEAVKESDCNSCKL